jgi:hypothetical protein
MHHLAVGAVVEIKDLGAESAFVELNRFPSVS